MRSRTLAAVIAALVLVGLALLVPAATSGPDDVLRGDGPGAPQPSPQPEDEVPPPESTPGQALTCEDLAETSEERGRCDSDPAWWRAAVGVLDVLAVLLLTGGAVLAALRLGRLAWEHRPRRPAAPVSVPDHGSPSGLEEAIATTVAEQQRGLAEGTPRNAIVACWHRFEDLARRAGVPPEPWETPAEFTERALADLGADPHALAWLAGLYREARFSEHPLTEADRASARAALEDVLGGMRT